MLPGEIYLADFPEAGKRPVIVVSREPLNRGRYVVVVPCTSSRFAVRRNLPSCVPFLAGQFGMTLDCVAQCENLFSIDKVQVDLENGPMGSLDESMMRDLIKAVGFVLASDCEPT
jgi:mRNA-degrading endonuclease toxin of MazEF toxin-antitoxin module